MTATTCGLCGIGFCVDACCMRKRIADTAIVDPESDGDIDDGSSRSGGWCASVFVIVFQCALAAFYGAVFETGVRAGVTGWIDDEFVMDAAIVLTECVSAAVGVSLGGKYWCDTRRKHSNAHFFTVFMGAACGWMLGFLLPSLGTPLVGALFASSWGASHRHSGTPSCARGCCIVIAALLVFLPCALVWFGQLPVTLDGESQPTTLAKALKPEFHDLMTTLSELKVELERFPWRDAAAYAWHGFSEHVTGGARMRALRELGLPADSSQDTIKSTYRKLAKKHHPDRPGGDQARFIRLQRAYDELNNHEHHGI